MVFFVSMEGTATLSFRTRTRSGSRSRLGSVPFGSVSTQARSVHNRSALHASGQADSRGEIRPGL